MGVEGDLSGYTSDDDVHVQTTMDNGTADDTPNSSALQRSVDFVNHELASAGFPEALQFSSFGNAEEASRILNCICTLLQQRQKDVAFREDLQYRLRRLSSDNDDLAGSVARHKARLEQTEKELVTAQNKLDTAQKSLKKEIEKHTTAREELKTVKSNFHYSKTQYNHDLRKRERDLQKLKERMQRTALDHSKVSITLVNPVAKTVATGSRKEPKRQDDVMYEVVMKNYEEREKELMSENQLLRETLFSTFSELKNRFEDSTAVKDLPRDRAASQEADEDTVDRAHFQMPFNLVQNSVQQRIRHVMLDLKDEWENLAENLIAQERNPQSDIAERMAALEEQNLQYQEIIEEQERLLGLQLQDMNALHEVVQAGDETSAAEILEQKRELEENKRQLERERSKFTEAAIKLGLERAALQRDKAAFEEQGRAQTTQAFLGSLPETPAWLREKISNSGMPAHVATPSRISHPLRPRSHLTGDLESSIFDTPSTAFGRTYSNSKPTQKPEFPEKTDEERYELDGMIAPSDTLLQTPKATTTSYLSPIDRHSDFTPSSAGGLSGRSGTTASTPSFIRSALKKTVHPTVRARSVRITVDEAEGRSFRPGEGDRSVSELGSSTNSISRGVTATRRAVTTSKPFLATSTPNSVSGGEPASRSGSLNGAAPAAE
ncbi:hypothetical protein HKX48_004708 [Thoreauomyces humboldtii]|nr:hypothetical protein HKX48_004708 [Thoreauomyces humboldtii]